MNDLGPCRVSQAFIASMQMLDEGSGRCRFVWITDFLAADAVQAVRRVESMPSVPIHVKPSWLICAAKASMPRCGERVKHASPARQ